MTNRLEGKVAIVTGGASGLGREVVDLMTVEGASVVVFDRDADAAERVAHSLLQAGRRVMPFAGDVTKTTDVEAAIAAAEGEFGQLDILHNNAGVQLEKPLHLTTDQEYDWVMGVNLRGVFVGCRAAVQTFLRNGTGGAIVNTTSIAAHAGDNAVCVYSATKAGVLGLTRSIATGYAGAGIRCNSVSPGDMETPMIEKYFKALPDPSAARLKMESAYPGKRIAHPREVAQAVLFLASDEASFITGECIIADGGLLASLY